jgi:hypothetical protein
MDSKMPIFYTPNTEAAINVENSPQHNGVEVTVRGQVMGAVDLRATADYFADLADLLDGTVTAEELNNDITDAMWFLAVHAEPTDDWGDFTFGPVDDDDFTDPDFADPDFDDDDDDDDDNEFDNFIESVLADDDEDIADAEVLNDASAAVPDPDGYVDGVYVGRTPPAGSPFKSGTGIPGTYVAIRPRPGDASECFATAKELPVDEDPDELARMSTVGPYKGMCGYDVGG